VVFFNMTWKLIIDESKDGFENMAIDAALLEQVDSAEAPQTIVRFYTWRRPTVSLGRNQQPHKAVDVDYCKTKGIDIVHRPTGGRAVLHDDELTYAVISNDSDAFGDTIYGNYKRVSEALRLGYTRLGVPAVLAPETRKPSSIAEDGDPPCFASPSRYELMVQGRKIAGSAQRRIRRSFLQHGSLLITCDRDVLARITRVADPRELDQAMAGVAEFLPGRPNLEELTTAFIQAFQDYFTVEFML
jgi:lipoate-protein ligase A